MSEASDILDRAKKRYKLAVDSWNHIYMAAKADLDFLGDDPAAQWDSDEWQRRIRVGRPAIQVDQLTQFVHQVVNDIKMNTPTILAIPADMDSDPETAEIIQGRIKAIEYKSNADSPYDTAANFSVGSSIGFIRVSKKYIDDESFEQELRIERVINPLAVYIDPDSIEVDGSDAKYAFVLEEVSKEDFSRQWPDATAISFGDDQEIDYTEETQQNMVTIAEYFEFEESEEDYGLLPDGTKEKFDGRKKYKSKRKIKKRVIKHMKLSGEDVLEETTFPGKYIPIVPVYGEEHWIKGKRHLLSLIRKAKPAQRMYNLWKSLETELLLKQQQAPVQAAAGQMAGFEESWEKPDEAMVLYYHQKDANGDPAPAPQRLQPPTVPTGIVNAARESVDDIKATLGMYNASIGQRSNETSGKAIMARQQEGDVATYHFGDNLVKSITQVGKIIVCALPEVEDSNRYVTIIDKEENFKMVGINGAMTKDQERTYDFTKGKYDIRVITGAPFTTQRQEAAALYNQTIQAMPDLMPVIGDLVFKYQDAPGAQAIAERMKKLVDPKFLDEKDREGMQDAQAQQVQALVQGLQQQIAVLTQEVQSKQADAQVKMAEVQIKAQEVEIKKGELQLKLMQAQKPELVVDDSFDKALKAKEVEIKAFDAETKRMAALKDTPELLKTPEQIQLEEQEMQMKMLKEAQEREQEMLEMQIKQQQADAVIQSLGGISQQLAALTATVSQPIALVRDEAGNLIGAN